MNSSKQDSGVPSGSGSRPSGGAATASPAKPSIPNAALLELAGRVEQGHADYQRTLLADAAYAVLGDEADHRDDPTFWPRAMDFTAKLRAEAYLDAALTLVPDDLAYQQFRRLFRPSSSEKKPYLAKLYDGMTCVGESEAVTPALALCAAALRARAASAIEAGTVETEGLDAKHESAVAKPDAQDIPHD